MGRGEQGAPCTGCCAFSCVEPCGHSAQRSELCPGCLRWFLRKPTSHLHSAHTHTTSAQTSSRAEQLTTWGLWVHAGTDHRHLRNLLFPTSPILGCNHDSTTCYQVLTNPSPSRGEAPQAPSPTGDEGMWAAREGSRGWPGLDCCGHLVLP